MSFHRICRIALAAGFVLFVSRPLAADTARPLAAGDRLPPLRGALLSGQKFVMPDSAAGRNTLLLLGFSYESRFDVEKWAERFQRDLGRDPRVSFLEVPVIGSAGRLARPFIDGGMRRSTPPQMQRHVLTVYRDAGLWKRLAGHAAPNVAYVLLVGRDGRVLWRGAGPFGEEAWLEVAAQVERLAK